MIPLVDISYVRLGTADLEENVRFATEIVGLELVERSEKVAYVRGDNRNHDICYFQGSTSDHTTGFEIEHEEDYEAAKRALTDAGVEVREGTAADAQDRRVIDFFTFIDPTGNKIDLVHRPFFNPEPFLPSRKIGIDEFSHVGLNSTDPGRDEKFWVKHFNFRVNDRIGTAPLMSFDHIHHRLALFPTTKPGVQHINFQVDGIDSIMRSWYFLQERQVKIRFGPGRHPSSSAMFLYFEGPDEVIYEYSWGVREVSPETWRPRQFPFANHSFCHWGAVPQIDEFLSLRDE
jgi:2,3-dihydroxy-p-cumate/2,3-dihydroxybenzoate 3,4-dioxygenase